MITICIVLFILYAVLGIVFEKKIINPITILSAPWAIIVYLSSLKLYTLNEASDESYGWILLGVSMFVMGYYGIRLLCHKKSVHFKIGHKILGSIPYVQTIRYQRCYILLICCILFIIYRMQAYGISIFTTGLNLKSIGTAVSENGGGSSGLINAISFLIISPLFLTLTVLAGVDFWMGKRDKKLLVLAIVMTIGRIFISGGRQAVIHFFIVLLVGGAFPVEDYKVDMYGRLKKIDTKKKVLGVVIVGLGAFMLLSITKTSAVFKTLYLDFAMQPYMLQRWASALGDKQAYGFSSLFGFIHPLLYIGKNFFRFYSEMPSFFADIYNMNQDTFYSWVKIGSSLSANAYSTAFWYLYYDARELGIGLGMFIFGSVSFNTYNDAKRFNTMKCVSNYIMIAICILYSFMDMEFSKASFVLAFVYLNVFVYKDHFSGDLNDPKENVVL